MWQNNKVIFYIVGAGLLFLFVYYYIAEFMAIFGSLLFASLGIMALKITDDILLKNVNTYDEIIKKKNLSYSYYILAVAIIISSGLVAGALIFYRL